MNPLTQLLAQRCHCLPVVLEFPPQGFIGFTCPGQTFDATLDGEWFDQVRSYALTSLGQASDHRPKVSKQSRGKTKVARKKGTKTKQKQKSETPKDTATAAEEDVENESLLTSWIPPALEGLLEDHVRADQWEVTVAYGFRALGFEVEVRGQQNPGQAEPDCIATYTSPTGQMIELIIDAKAGQWNAPVDDIRAMRDYMALSAAYAHPLFVANSLGKSVPDRLDEHVMQGKTARAMSGRDLALLIKQRLTDPDFNVALEFRQIVL